VAGPIILPIANISRTPTRARALDFDPHQSSSAANRYDLAIEIAFVNGCVMNTYVVILFAVGGAAIAAYQMFGCAACY
jgi:hypothetical protein